MPLLKNGKIIEDNWTRLADDAALPSSGLVYVSFDRWEKDRDALLARTEPVGIWLAAGQSPKLIADDLDKLSLVALEFPAFTDGRAYSYARLLHRSGFDGEIRAIGNVLRDQYLNMKRCGIDALEIKSGETEDDWLEATTIISAPYQTAYDPSEPIMSLRERRLAAAG